MLGVQPAVGRAFREEESQPGKDMVVLLGDDVWRKLYNADPQVAGKILTIKSKAYTIVGVMPRGFSFPAGDAMQYWSPAAITAANRSAMSGDNEIVGDLYARLPEGMTMAQLAAALSRTQAMVAREVTDDDVPTRIGVTGYQQTP